MKLFKDPFVGYRKSSLGMKLTLSHTALALVIVLIICAMILVTGYHYSLSSATDSLLDKARQIASWQDFSAPTPPAEDDLMRYGNLTNARVFLAMSENSAIYAHFSDEEAEAVYRHYEIDHSDDRELVACVLTGESMTAVRNSRSYDRKLILAGVPIYSQDGSVYCALILAQSLNYFQYALAAHLFLLLMSGAFALTLSLVLSLLFSKRMVKPIRKMTRAAELMSEGDYSSRVQINREDELGVLAETLNTLCERTGFAISRMREDRDRLQTVINGVQEGLLLVNPKLEILYCNSALLWMLELPNRNVFSQDSPTAVGLKELLQQALDSGHSENTVLTTPSGRRIYAAVQPLSGKKGELPGAVCLLRDVSESERMEQLRRDYVANVSHELRTPLTGIRGMVEPLIDGCMETEDEKQSCYHVIYEETLRLEKLVQEMLDMSQMQNGRLKIELERLDASGILKAAHARFLRPAELAGVSLRYETDACSLPCLGNEDRILQVLIIFLDNALAFTPAGGTVTLFARSGTDEITLGVRDTGVGIEHKDLPYVWERFYKADKSRRHSTGTGLGLAIAKLVVEHMQGKIECESEPGRGSEFRFQLRKF